MGLSTPVCAVTKGFAEVDDTVEQTQCINKKTMTEACYGRPD